MAFKIKSKNRSKLQKPKLCKHQCNEITRCYWIDFFFLWKMLSSCSTWYYNHLQTFITSLNFFVFFFAIVRLFLQMTYKKKSIHLASSFASIHRKQRFSYRLWLIKNDFYYSHQCIQKRMKEFLFYFDLSQ